MTHVLNTEIGERGKECTLFFQALRDTSLVQMSFQDGRFDDH